MHYYRYASTEDAAKISSESEQPKAPSAGRTIDPEPVLSLLLEPRSLVITMSSLYEEHLHGIEAISEDVLLATEKGEAEHHVKGFRVGNWKLLKRDIEQQVATFGGVLKRDTRVSLTCRDVEQVLAHRTRS